MTTYDAAMAAILPGREAVARTGHLVADEHPKATVGDLVAAKRADILRQREQAAETEDEFGKRRAPCGCVSVDGSCIGWCTPPTDRGWPNSPPPGKPMGDMPADFKVNWQPDVPKRGSPTWEERTAAVDTLLAEQEAEKEPTPVEQIRAALLDAAALDGIPAPVPVIHDVLYRDSINWLMGKPGNGKSFVALDMAGSVGTGEMWQGYPVTTGPVIYVAAEGVAGMRGRVRAWEQAAGTDMTGVRWLPMAVQVDTEFWRALAAVCAEIQPALIVLDTQARITVGMEENSARDMGQFVNELEYLRRKTGACVLVVHHQGRNGEHMRGSSALDGAANTVIQVVKDNDELSLRCLKQKDGPEFDEVKLRLVPMGESVILAHTDGSSKRDAVNNCARWLKTWREMFRDEEVSVTTLVDSNVVSKTVFHKYKYALIDAGLMVREGKGNATRYRLTDPGSAGAGTAESRSPTSIEVVGLGTQETPIVPGSHGTPAGLRDYDLENEEKPCSTCGWQPPDDRLDHEIACINASESDDAVAAYYNCESRDVYKIREMWAQRTAA